MKRRSGLNAYHAPKPAIIRTSSATFSLFDISFRFSSSNFVTNCWSWTVANPYKKIFTRRELGRRSAFVKPVDFHLCGSLRPSAFSALKFALNAENAEGRREPQRWQRSKA